MTQENFYKRVEMGRTPTSEILHRWVRETNPVTRCVYREILGKRLDDIEAKQAAKDK